MTLGRIWRDVRGATAVEFGMTAPIFFMLLFGVIEGGRLLWTQVALQHGAEMAARCASIGNTTLCPSVKDYAAQETLGLHPPSSVFTVTPGTETCVKANYTFTFFTAYSGTPSLSLSAQSCVPT